MVAAPSELNLSTLTTDAEPIFRVVEDQDGRRGLRLEQAYWKILRRIATATAQKTGALVKSITSQAPEVTNTTSLLRVYCLKWVLEESETLRQISDPSLVVNLVRASPSAAFALGLDKRIIAFNQPFQTFVQARFAALESGAIGRDFRLALDTHLNELAVSLRVNGNVPAQVGFVVGFGDRRARGTLNAILAPVAGRDIVLCYVLS